MEIKVCNRTLLTRVRERYSQADIAGKLDVSPKTVRLWEIREDGPPDYRAPQLQMLLLGNKTHTQQGRDFTFIDLFAGIGGIRMGFEKNGGHCIFTSEWDKYAVKTYCENFATDHPVVGDITKVVVEDIPDHDVLLAGFPCQPFSIAGVSKKNSMGRVHGFECQTQGTLFFDVARIIKEKQPKAFLLENVKNLMSHDKGRTFQVIKETLQDELGYKISPKVIDAKGFVPQHRERIYIVGFREDTDFSWDAFGHKKKDAMTIGDILHPQDSSEDCEKETLRNYIVGRKGKVNDKYILSDKLWKYLYDYAAKHKAKGNGFGYGMVKKTSIARTLSARYYKDGSEILVHRGRGNPRRLTPRECARLMGFDKPGESKFKIPVSDTQAYKQFGNSVAMPVIEEIARIMKPHIMTLIEEEEHKIHQYALLASG
ncbi:MAG: DNA (cytosine-5-)-methyltransferase [Gammaproteobacteria bacterium]|nr:DNA (cytosine-5-)-methyltransferase [Gammaproteobacteria bacterium]